MGKVFIIHGNSNLFEGFEWTTIEVIYFVTNKVIPF